MRTLEDFGVSMPARVPRPREMQVRPSIEAVKQIADLGHDDFLQRYRAKYCISPDAEAWRAWHHLHDAPKHRRKSPTHTH